MDHPAAKVLSVMPQGRAMELLNILCTFGILTRFHPENTAITRGKGKVKRIQPDEATEPFWMRI